VLRFHWRLVKRLPELLWASASRVEKVIGVVSFLLSVFGLTAWFATLLAAWLDTWWPISPLWALLPLAFLFVYGLMKANYEAFQEVDDRKEELEKKLEEKKKRMALRRLLGEAVTRGHLLRAQDPSRHEAEVWGRNTHDLVVDALTVAEAEFLLAGDYPDATTDLTDTQRWMKYRIDRIMKLLEQLHNFDINPNFNPDNYPKDWMSR
jgi:hypothetical protein